MINYIAYYRVSTQKQNLGLEAQQKTVTDHIRHTNGVLLNEYSEKESGKSNTRLELKKALEESKEKGATLIIAKLDRLSRNVSFIFALRDYGVKIHCCDIPELNTMNLGIFATLAQYEAELISSRTKLALAAKKRQGFKLGKDNLTNNPDNLNKCIERSRQVRKEKQLDNQNLRKANQLIKALRDAGKNWTAIAKILESGGFETSTGNKNWQTKQVQRVYNLYDNLIKAG